MQPDLRIGSLCSGYEGHPERRTPIRLLWDNRRDRQAFQCPTVPDPLTRTRRGGASHEGYPSCGRRQLMANRIEKTCQWCGKQWTPYRPEARGCSPSCRSFLRAREMGMPGGGPRRYPESIIRQVQELYAGGATTKEIDRIIGPGYKAQTLVRRFVAERRKPGKRPARAAENDNWRGDEAGYSAMHLRVTKARGRPKHCVMCDTTDPDIRYEWANLSGHFEDISDYVRACVPCHRRFDARRRAAQSAGEVTPNA